MRFPKIHPLYFNREYPPGSRMYFELLQRRLIEALRRCIGNGLLTERGLARAAGISQPHVHHILKGARALSPEMADRMLRALRLTVIDLLELAEMETYPGRQPGALAPERIQWLVVQARASEGAPWPPAPEEARPRIHWERDDATSR